MHMPSLNTCLPCRRFAPSGQYDAAKEGLLKLGDIAGLLHLNVEERRWDDAFLLLAAHSQLKDQVYLPYAKWLLSQDRCADWRFSIGTFTKRRTLLYMVCVAAKIRCASVSLGAYLHCLMVAVCVQV